MAWEFEKVAGPFKGRTGGLAWDGKGMLVSAVAEESIYRYDPATAKAEIFRKYTGRTNGLAVMKDGSVLGAQEGGRRVVHFLKDGSTAPTEELLDGKDHHNQPVDLIVDSKGRAWVADPWNSQPPYGPPAYPFLPHASVLLLEGIGARQWRLTRVTHDTLGPRALLLSKDEKTLYVADGDIDRGNVCQLFAYPVIAGGEVGHGKPLVTFQAVDRGIEGMCLDADGNIVACAGWKRSGTGPMLYVISPAGTILESQPAPADVPMRCAFGDAGLGSLYVTAGDGGLYREEHRPEGIGEMRSSFIPHPSSLVRWIAAAWIAIFAAGAIGQTYPTRPIRIIALSAPGSGPDIVGRLIGSKLTEAWGQQVIVDARPAATGIVGSEIAARAAPDGYTLVIITSQAVIVSVMYDKLNYDLARDFTPVTYVASTPFILAVNPSVAATSVKELIALAKSKPGQLRYGSGGSGSPPHLSVEMLRSMTGIDVLHIPYKGVTPAMVDTVAGQVQFLISVIPAVLPTVKSGKLRALGVTSAKRTALLPELPTIAETVPGYEFIGWYSVFAPAKTPAAIVAKLNAGIGKALETPEFRDKFTALGAEPHGSTPKELATYLRAQIEKMRKAVKDSGAHPD